MAQRGFEPNAVESEQAFTAFLKVVLKSVNVLKMDST